METQTEIIDLADYSEEEIIAQITDACPYYVWAKGEKLQLPSGDTAFRHASCFRVLFHPRSIVRVQAYKLSIVSPKFPEQRVETSVAGNPFDELRKHFEFLNKTQAPNERSFSGGLVGFISYDTGRYFERISGATSGKTEPDIYLLEAPLAIDVDIRKRQVQLRWLKGYCTCEDLDEARHVFSVRPKNVPRPLVSKSDIVFHEAFSKKEFMNRVARAKEYICAGDIFQVVLANTFSSPRSIDPFRVFFYLHENNASPFHFLVRFGEQTLLGASPEVMLRSSIEDGENMSVSMRLVAGTYPTRSIASQAELLGNDTKELAEHLMLVDHVRNDIGRVSQIGKVEVRDLFSIESYANVHHLVSEVRGFLRPGENALSALMSCFPIATLTGTPKIRAMEIIAELEAQSRGIFGGAVVELGYDGSIDSCVAIRSMITGEFGTKVQAGAGIVYDSDPAREYAECYWKAMPLFEAVNR